MRRAFFLLAFLAAPASAQMTTGNDLYQFCTGTTDQKIECLNYLSGWRAAAETMSILYANRTPPSSPVFCLPNGATTGQIYDVVVKHLRDNPASRHQMTSILLLVAMRDNFPCR